MKQNVELLASYWTIAGGALPHTDREYSPFDFKDRVEAAAKAGFKGIGLWHADLAHLLERYTLQEMKQILDGNGMKHLELEFLTDWFVEGAQKKISDERKKLLMSAAAALGARHIKVGDFTQTPCPMPRLIEAFRALCREAAEHGTRILFELMPFCLLQTLPAALEMVAGAGEKNGGIMFEPWHMSRMGIANEELARVPSEYLLGAELDDGTREAPWSLHEDTINHRRLCGEGELDVRGFIRAVQKAGYTGPFGVEVLNQEMRAWPLEKLVTRAFTTTMAQFES